MDNQTLNDLATKTIGCALTAHRPPGPGLLESAYRECLCNELRVAGLWVQKEKALPLVYQEVRIECGYRVDLVVEGKLFLDVKSVDALNDIHLAQVLTYLKFSQCTPGLLINFNVVLLSGLATYTKDITHPLQPLQRN